MRCCDVKIGELRTAVTVQDPVTTDIGGGATERSWADAFTTKGRFRFLSGGERLAAERIDAQTKARLVVRYNANITASKRVVVDGTAYNIRFVNDVELRHRWMELDLDGGVAT